MILRNNLSWGSFYSLIKWGSIVYQNKKKVKESKFQKDDII